MNGSGQTRGALKRKEEKLGSGGKTKYFFFLKKRNSTKHKVEKRLQPNTVKGKRLRENLHHTIRKKQILSVTCFE